MDEDSKFSSKEIFNFHFEISGIIKSELHPLNILFISILSLNSHFEIFGV